MKRKYKFMIGTTSRVPDHPGWHYLILDIDSPNVDAHLQRIAEISNWIMTEPLFQRTQSGFHYYTDKKMRLGKMLSAAKNLGADPGWCRIARKRGYAFLADKGPVKLPWPVERMTVTTL